MEENSVETGLWELWEIRENRSLCSLGKLGVELGRGGGKKRRNHGAWGCWTEHLRGLFPFR